MKWRSMDTVPKTGDDLVAKPFLALLPIGPHTPESDRVVVSWWEPKVRGGIFIKEGADIDLPVSPIGWLPLATSAGMPMDFADFHNALRILLNIDQPEFDETLDPMDRQEAGALAGEWADRKWRRFRDDPHRYFIEACDSQAKKLFAIIEERSYGPQT